MKTRTLLKAVLLLSGLVFALGTASAAGAQVGTTVTTEDYGPPPGITVDSSTVAQGGNVTVRGISCNVGNTVTITFNGVAVGTAVVGADGSWSHTFAVPAGTPPGTYSVTETGCITGGGSLSTSVQVLGSGVVTTTLPYTGSNIDLPLRAGLVLFAVGGVLVFAASRRRATSVR